MAEKLRKYKSDNPTSKLVRMARQRIIEDNELQPESPTRDEDIKAEILASLRHDISQIQRRTQKCTV